MNIGIALLHGLIWSLMWCVTVNITEMKWPHVFLHDYPKELQAVIVLPEFTNKKPAFAFLTVSMTLIVAFLFWSPIYTFYSTDAGFGSIFLHVWIVTMCWNLFDLLVMDWLIFCTWRPSFIVLPGSEGHKSYRNYAFHLIGFLKGSVIVTVGSLIVAALSYGCLELFFR